MIIEPVDLHDPDQWKSACCIAACFGVRDANRNTKPMTTRDIVRMVAMQFGVNSMQYRSEQSIDLVRIYEAAKDGAETAKTTTKKRKCKK